MIVNYPFKEKFPEFPLTRSLQYRFCRGKGYLSALQYSFKSIWQLKKPLDTVGAALNLTSNNISGNPPFVITISTSAPYPLPGNARPGVAR
jgi:hypothetical protein